MLLKYVLPIITKILVGISIIYILPIHIHLNLLLQVFDNFYSLLRILKKA